PRGLDHDGGRRGRGPRLGRGAGVGAPAGRTAMNKLRKITGGAPFYPLFVLFGLNAVDRLDYAAFGILTPNIRDSFGLSLVGITSLITLTLPLQLVLGIPIAYMADRTRRIRLAMIGATLWAFFSAAT